MFRDQSRFITRGGGEFSPLTKYKGGLSKIVWQTVRRIGVNGLKYVVLSYLPLVAWEVFPKVVLLLFLSSLLTQIYDTGRLKPGLKTIGIK